jgi:hypothetical protein
MYKLTEAENQFEKIKNELNDKLKEAEYNNLIDFIAENFTIQIDYKGYKNIVPLKIHQSRLKENIDKICSDVRLKMNEGIKITAEYESNNSFYVFTVSKPEIIWVSKDPLFNVQIEN